MVSVDPQSTHLVLSIVISIHSYPAAVHYRTSTLYEAITQSSHQYCPYLLPDAEILLHDLLLSCYTYRILSLCRLSSPFSPQSFIVDSLSVDINREGIILRIPRNLKTIVEVFHLPNHYLSTCAIDQQHCYTKPHDAKGNTC